MANAGQLENNPLAELIREVIAKGLSGAVRLSQNQAKAVVYCENGGVIFAASNLRAHRLTDFLKRNQILNDEQLAALARATDDEVFAQLARNGRVKPDIVKAIRINHISDILRAVLLWTNGEWQFDARVRIGSDTRVTIDVKRMLLECARHLPGSYLVSRFKDQTESLDLAKNNGHQAKLLPPEAFVLSRITAPTSLKDLLVISGLNEEETLRAVYGLSLSGLLQRSEWPRVDITVNGKVAAAPVKEIDVAADLQSLLARLEKAHDHYAVLGVDKEAGAAQVRDAYHALARKYHPDRFHQSDAGTRRQVESAFARIAKAHETLVDQTARDAYDAQLAEKTAQAKQTSAPVKPAPKPEPPVKTEPRQAQPQDQDRAEVAFQRGVEALNNRQPENAIRFLAEAASLNPRNGRYRAEYGRALSSRPQTRRLAEIELKAALELEPNNGNFRVILAELYQALGLRRRAAGEIQKVLTFDPKNAAARALLASLKK